MTRDEQTAHAMRVLSEAVETLTADIEPREIAAALSAMAAGWSRDCGQDIDVWQMACRKAWRTIEQRDNGTMGRA